jgi:8-oxo-dGTP diphosphatase
MTEPVAHCPRCHCPRCGDGLPHPPPATCTACGYTAYLNARPTGSAIVLVDGAYLAVQRAREPNAGRWDLPGGFAEAWEHPADAAVRELREELGVEVALREFVGMFVGAYHFQDERLPVLDCFWTADIVGGELTLDLTENTRYGWLPMAERPDLAFETQNEAIAVLQQRLGVADPRA